MSMKNPLTPAGIEPATFWCVAQRNLQVLSFNKKEQQVHHQEIICIQNDADLELKMYILILI